MRKHPVDDLFKRRLSDIEKTPSSAAWEKIQAKNKNERQLAGWIRYAAASVVIAIIAGYAVWNGQRSNMNTIGKERKIAVTSEPAKSAEPAADSKKDSQKIEIKAEPISAPANELTTKTQKPTLAQQSLKNRNIKEEVVAEKENTQVEPEKLASVNLEVKEESIPALPHVEVSPKIEQVASTKITPEPTTEPTRTIVVAIQTNDQEEDKPKSKFSKVFRQLKNARAGERVDWEEVGFNPKSLVAKVDDRLRNGEEKVSEKYHNLKEKTKL